MQRALFLFFAMLCGIALTIPQSRGADWPTLHGDLARSGYYSVLPKLPVKLAWRHELHMELIGPRCEVIVGGGNAYVGSYAGIMRAWDAATGELRWAFSTKGPIGHSPMYSHDTLYFGSMDHHIYAVRCADGELLWRFETAEGIWTSPVVYEGYVYVGDRAGILYAIDARSGQLAWQHATGGPILTTASVDSASQRVVVGSEDMHLYCLDALTGKLYWVTDKLSGLSLRDYFPTIVGGVVLATTNPVRDFHAVLGTHQQFLLRRAGIDPKEGEVRYLPSTPGDIDREQDAILEYLNEHEDEQTFHAFRLVDGTRPWIAPILYTAGLHNPPTPACFHPKTLQTYVFYRSAYTTWDGGGEVRPLTGVGTLNLETGRVTPVEHSYPSSEPPRPPGRKDMPWGVFATIGDETQALSCSDDWLFSNHQGTLGGLRWADRRCVTWFGRRDTYGGFYGPGNFGWEKDGGLERARNAGQPYGLVNEWHGPARGIASVADGRVYYTVGSQVLCFEGAGP